MSALVMNNSSMPVYGVECQVFAAPAPPRYGGGAPPASRHVGSTTFARIPAGESQQNAVDWAQLTDKAPQSGHTFSMTMMFVDAAGLVWTRSDAGTLRRVV
ncbi:hypothetical protein M8C17_02735 [Micromonospora sp. RHAY321]|uniref:hypothetical protein n=1 Tax=Micromonospora sp. RHAY321 TaxID=2944807 RepID=UPI00207C7556|nr:hypothetical protein [Micromonospora sp. RHAY321]MCO1594070.1 hypothetical protein [Micromonospora sp. RHAY321]